MADEKFTTDLARAEAQGAARYGDNWKVAIDAIGRSVGAGGIPEANMRQVLAQPDPARTLFDFAKECLLQQSDAGNHDAETAYRSIRNAERELYRKSRGR